MNKDQAVARLKELQAHAASIQIEVRALRKIIEAPQALLTKPVPGSEQDYWVVGSGYPNGFSLEWCGAYSEQPEYYSHGNIFQSEELANDYAQALNTLLLLRHQPGTVPAKDTGNQFIIEPDWKRNEGNPSLYIKARELGGLIYKMARVSPCFETLKDAKNAIEAIGEDALMHMFKTLHHIKEEP